MYLKFFIVSSSEFSHGPNFSRPPVAPFASFCMSDMQNYLFKKRSVIETMVWPRWPPIRTTPQVGPSSSLSLVMEDTGGSFREEFPAMADLSLRSGLLWPGLV